jgi:hypothetical protein
MMQMEVENSGKRLSESSRLMELFSQIDMSQSHSTIQSGSLIETDSGWFLFSVGLGKIEFDGITVFAISGASPIGQALAGAEKGSAVSFQNRSYNIVDIH